jgi:hypothetical protein
MQDYLSTSILVGAINKINSGYIILDFIYIILILLSVNIFTHQQFKNTFYNKYRYLLNFFDINYWIIVRKMLSWNNKIYVVSPSRKLLSFANDSKILKKFSKTNYFKKFNLEKIFYVVIISPNIEFINWIKLRFIRYNQN